MPHKTKIFLSSLPHVFGSLWQNRTLVYQLARRDVVGRYRGSYLGLLWSLFYPLLMLAVYTFVFGIVFRTRWGVSVTDSKFEFAVVLFTGLLVFGLFSECVNRAPTLIVGNPSYVKRVVFPLEILPWVAFGSSLFHLGINLGVLTVASLALFGKPVATWPWIFPVLVPLALMTLGITWFLAALGVYLRDVAQAVTVITTMLMFLSPIFYPATAVPQAFQSIYRANPLTFVIEQARDVLLWGTPPDLPGLAAHTVGGLLVAWLGLAWFQSTRGGFADVL